MARVYRKGENEMREVEIFHVELDDGEQEAMRANPGRFVREVLESEMSRVNRVSLDVDMLDDLANGGSARTWVVHHTVSGSEESSSDVSRPV